MDSNRLWVQLAHSSTVQFTLWMNFLYTKEILSEEEKENLRKRKLLRR